MNVSIVGVLPWQEAMKSDFIVSTFMEKIYGTKAAMIATLLVLWIAFASLFAVLLGYSRVPYAAAADGKFFPEFAKLHPTKEFPYVSLLFIGGLGFIFSLLFKLGDVISAILAMRILVQFVAQAIGVIQLRKRNGTKNLPFKMWLYPLPVIFSIATWLFVFYSTGTVALLGVLLIAIGLIVFYFTKDLWNKSANVE
jgi:amino acid transporter